MSIALRFFATVLLGCAFCQCSRGYDPKESERYIVDSERQWAESVASGDTSGIERFIADDFIGVDPKGKTYNKSEMISDTRTAPKYYLSNHLNEVKVRFHRDCLIENRLA